MTRPLTFALLGALALGGVSLISEPASALPVSGLSPVASNADVGGTVEQARYYRRGYDRRGFGFRRGYYGYRRPYGYGYRRPGPIRRLINHL